MNSNAELGKNVLLTTMNDERMQELLTNEDGEKPTDNELEKVSVLDRN